MCVCVCVCVCVVCFRYDMDLLGFALVTDAVYSRCRDGTGLVCVRIRGAVVVICASTNGTGCFDRQW